MATEHSLSYRATGVVDNTQLGLSALLKWVNASAAFRSTGAGRRVVDVGYFASVVQITDTLGLALCTDGVGSKVLVAEMLGRYDTIGIDCVAMNVNDAICVGAEPISFLDYIAIERATPEVLAGPAPYRLAPEGRRQPRIDRGPPRCSRRREPTCRTPAPTAPPVRRAESSPAGGRRCRTPP